MSTTKKNKNAAHDYCYRCGDPVCILVEGVDNDLNDIIIPVCFDCYDWPDDGI